ncbi:MAG TPA: SDR family oxidoreductase [Gaiellaceae bacterium]|nr:SDR family oxidoreductase [Gaiellaceae bacterium]
MSLLAGRHALVTGAANGIGRAVGERFRAEGAIVSGVDREEGVEFQFDLTDTAGLAGLVDGVEAENGPVEVLVSVAGVFEPARAVEMTLDSYRRVLAVNLDAPIMLAQRCGRGMAERGYGRILSVTSIHGEFGEELSLSYDASKAGLNGATRTLAIELGPQGVLVNALAPGFVRTRMSVVEGHDELESEWFKTVYLENRKLPLRRPAEPPEIAAHAAWLCSDENTYLTGQVVRVDGGVTVTF